MEAIEGPGNSQGKRLEEEPIHTREEWENIFQAIGHPTLLLDPDQKITSVNLAAIKATGRSAAELVGKKCCEIFHRTSQPPSGCPFEKMLRSGHLEAAEMEIEALGGTFLVSCAPVLDAAGKLEKVIHIATDITERKRAEDAQRESEEKYRTLTEQSLVGIVVIQDTSITFSNDALAEISGYSVEELLSLPPAKVQALIHPEDQTLAWGRVQDQLTGKAASPQHYQFRIIRKDGAIRWLEVHSNRIEYGGKPALQGVFIDITEHKQAEIKYKNIIETAFDGFWTTDLRGRFLDVNDLYCRMIGYTREELLKMSIPDVEAVEKSKETAEHIKMLIEQGYDRFETRHRRKDGKIIELEISTMYSEARDGQLIVFIRDITERKRAEEKLRQSEERYRLIAENTRDIIITTDMNLRLTYVSPSVEYLTGRTTEEVMAMSLEELLTPASLEVAKKAFVEELEIAKKQPRDPTRSRTLELEVIRQDGSTFWTEAKTNFLRGAEDQPVGLIAVLRDMTERRKAEEEKIELELKAQMTSRLASVGEMVAGVAHEINNPLTIVTGYAPLLMDRKDIPEDVRRDLALINDSAERVGSIIRRLLAFSRQTKPDQKLVGINELIEGALALQAYHLITSNITLTTQLAPDLPLIVADPGQIQQVLLNLIVNAEAEMKLAHGKGKLTITTARSDNTIKISVKDDGPGIKPEIIDRIFDPFFTTRKVGQGTGLGLSLCYGIVAEHNGRIYAKSKPGKGATFIVELPIVTEVEVPEPAEPVVEQAEPVVEQAEKVVKAKIMVIDDEKVIRDLAKRVLGGEGYEVDTVDNADDALKMIESQRYNLILLDIKMPGMDGVELYRRIQKIAKSLARRVIFITGDILSSDTEKFFAETKVVRIDKPFNAAQLKQEVKRVLTRGR